MSDKLQGEFVAAGVELRDPESFTSCLGCGEDCEHTEEEHKAFDDGVMAGCDGAEESDCPDYESFELREAWRTGCSVGALSR